METVEKSSCHQLPEALLQAYVERSVAPPRGPSTHRAVICAVAKEFEGDASVSHLQFSYAGIIRLIHKHRIPTGARKLSGDNLAKALIAIEKNGQPDSVTGWYEVATVDLQHSHFSERVTLKFRRSETSDGAGVDVLLKRATLPHSPDSLGPDPAIRVHYYESFALYPRATARMHLFGCDTLEQFARLGVHEKVLERRDQLDGILTATGGGDSGGVRVVNETTWFDQWSGKATGTADIELPSGWGTAELPTLMAIYAPIADIDDLSFVFRCADDAWERVIDAVVANDPQPVWNDERKEMTGAGPGSLTYKIRYQSEPREKILVRLTAPSPAKFGESLRGLSLRTFFGRDLGLPLP